MGLWTMIFLLLLLPMNKEKFGILVCQLSYWNEVRLRREEGG